MTCLNAALELARLGLAVLPVHYIVHGRCSCGNRNCDSPGKHPIAQLVPQGFKNASSNARTIAHWFTRYPDANLGMVTGPVVAIDVDPRNGGDASLHRLKQRHGTFPLTWQSATGGGGSHIFFAAPEGGIASAKLGKGIEFKANGGYVVVAPSQHVSGRCYAWQKDPYSTPLASLPEWVINTLRAPHVERRPIQTIDLDTAPARISGIIRTIAAAGLGERNRVTFWGACRLRELAEQHILPRDDAIAIAVEAAARNGLSYREARKTTLSAFRGPR
jgi:hypothetical protein